MYIRRIINGFSYPISTSSDSMCICNCTGITQKELLCYRLCCNFCPCFWLVLINDNVLLNIYKSLSKAIKKEPILGSFFIALHYHHHFLPFYSLFSTLDILSFIFIVLSRRSSIRIFVATRSIPALNGTS